jgi:mannose-6-phosphate isomerase-like protein (cupin superfamily)
MMKEYMPTRPALINNLLIMQIFRILFVAAFILAATTSAESQYLHRNIVTAAETSSEMTTSSAHYMAMFGEGTDSSSLIKGLSRYGNLRIDPGGESNRVAYRGEEEVIYILEGTGVLNIGRERIPVSSHDYIYIPEGSRFSLSNPREMPLSMFVMGFRITPGNKVIPSGKMMIASTDEVPFQVLGYHGPTTTFQLLMGTTESTRDRLAAACQVTSLFIMDFAAGGTNIPHRHDDEEEIYYILRGKGDIVAGETDGGKEYRHPSKEGDAYFFSPKTLIGFYSGNTECEEHAMILAVRFKYPGSGK